MAVAVVVMVGPLGGLLGVDSCVGPSSGLEEFSVKVNGSEPGFGVQKS